MAGRFSVEAVFKAVDRVTAPVTRMQNRIGKMTRGIARGFRMVNRAVNKFGRAIKRSAQVAVVSLALIGGAMANVIGAGAEFEQTLVNAAVKFPGVIRRGTEAFKALEDAARQTGRTTEFTATQSAQALNFLAMAGFSAEASIRALPGVVNLATVAQIDLGTASDIATDSLGAFNLLTKDAVQNQKNLTRITDVFAKATTSANLSVEEMFEAIKQGGPIGIAAGQSLETIATFAAKMADAGIKGTRAGTGLKNIFLALNAPTSAAAKVMNRLKIKTVDANGSIRDAIDVFKDFSRETKKLSDQKRLQVFNEIFGKIPIAAAINLTNAADSMKEFRKTLEGAGGAAKTMAGVMRDTLQGRLNALTSAVEGVKISIFSMTEGPLADVIEKLTEWVRANEKLIASEIGGFLAGIITNFKSIVIWTKRIAKGLAAFVAFAVVLKTLIGILTLVNLVMAANPIVLIVLGVVAAIAAFSALIIWIDDVAAAFDNMSPFIRAILFPLELVVRTIKFIKDALKGGFGSAVEKLAISLGFGGDAAAGDEQNVGATGPQIISPGERVARSIEEQRTTSTAEVTIRDETNRAEVTSGVLGPGIILQPSGAF